MDSDRHFDAPIPHLADVFEAGGGSTGRRSDDPADQGVLARFVVEGEFEIHPVVEQCRVEAQLELLGALRLQQGVAQRAEHQPRRVGLVHIGGERREEEQGVIGSRLPARGAPGSAETKAGQRAGLREEGFVRHHV